MRNVIKKFRKYKVILYSALILAVIVFLVLHFYIWPNSSTKVYNYKSFTVNFDKNLNESDVEKQNITVVDSKGTKINVSLGWNQGTKSITVFPPERGYKLGQTYYLKVGSSTNFTIENKPKNSGELKFTIKNSPNKKDIVAFKDKNLEKEIRNAINKPEGDIYKSDVEKITSLIATSKNISDISGLKSLVNLHVLCLDVNSISDISELKYLTDLELLGLSHNQIKDISSIKKLTNLKRLSLYGNNIKDYSSIKSITKQLMWKDY